MPLYTSGGTAILAMANTWTAKQTFSPPANTEALVVSGYSLTGANAQSLLDLSGTWNTTGTPTAFKINITDTASNASSLLMDLRVGGSSKFNVRKDGRVFIGLGAITDAGSGQLRFFGISSSECLQLTSNGIRVGFPGGISFSTTTGTNNPAQTLVADAANVTRLDNGTSGAQSLHYYGRRASSTDYHRGAIASSMTTLSAVSGASVTATGLIPDGAIVVGVTTKVTTALGTTNGTTGYTVGDGSDADRWGAITGTAAGTSSDNRDWTATTVQAFTSAQDVVITATGGNFDGTGVIDVCVFYLRGESD
jgi:hypothetical protein